MSTENTKLTQVERALDIVEAPWSGRNEGRLRKWFTEELEGNEKSHYLIDKILASDLESFIVPGPLLSINEGDIELLF